MVICHGAALKIILIAIHTSLMRYYKIHQGPQNTYAKLAIEQGFIGIGYDMPDMSQINLSDPQVREVVRNLYAETHPNTSKQVLGSGSGAVLRFLTVLQNGDILLVPLGDGTYKVGELIGDYYYAGPDQPIPHRRNVRWYATLDREVFSQSLKNTLGAIGTLSDITHQSVEIEALLSGDMVRVESVQSNIDQAEFALEKHLEDFLVENWNNTEFGAEYKLMTDEDGGLVAQQYQTEVGFLDIIAIKNDRSEILILELKKGRSGDAVVGQMLRYITAIKKEVAEPHQKIRAVILTGQDDKKIRYALESLNGLIEFMVYKISFTINRII